MEGWFMLSEKVKMLNFDWLRTDYIQTKQLLAHLDPWHDFLTKFPHNNLAVA